MPPMEGFQNDRTYWNNETEKWPSIYWAFTFTASQTDNDIKIIQSRSRSPSDPNYPSDALHIWVENAPVNEYNNKKLEEISGSLFVLKANDQYPTNVSKQDIDRVLARGRSETGGLDYEILIKEGARINNHNKYQYFR